MTRIPPRRLHRAYAGGPGRPPIADKRTAAALYQIRGSLSVRPAVRIHYPNTGSGQYGDKAGACLDCSEHRMSRGMLPARSEEPSRTDRDVNPSLTL